MALGLNDINKNKKRQKKLVEIENDFDKERVLRPWEGFEDLGGQTRTIIAQEAVRKARQIVERNNAMTQKFEEEWNRRKEEKEFNEFMQQKQLDQKKESDSQKKSFTDEEIMNLQIQHKKSGPFSFIRDLFR